MSRPPAKAGSFTPARRRAWLRLWRSENVGPRTFATLLKRFGSAEAALEALPALVNRAGRPVTIATNEAIDQELEAAAKSGTRFIAMAEADYPKLLLEIDSAPAVIAVRGRAELLNKPAIAIVGARNASAAGLALTERLSRGLGQAGYAIVSGFARGIDARAHRAALASGTIAVLAGGLDRPYPADQGPFLEKLLEDGVALSEMPSGYEARGRDFPRRNRIVSGLSLGVVVVEAARRSGSLITARFAADQGREVFAVPGSPLDPRAEGTNDLLRDGASFCCDVDDVLRGLAGRTMPKAPGDLFSDASDSGGDPLWDELDLSALETQGPPDAARAAPSPRDPTTRKSPARKPAGPRADDRFADPEEPSPGGMAEEARRPFDRIVEMLGPAPVSIDELGRAAELSVRDVRAALLELELAGRLERHGGGLVSLIMTLG